MVVKLADDTTLLGFISDNNETHYREEIQHLTGRYSDNNLVLNTSKTKEVIVDLTGNDSVQEKKFAPHCCVASSCR